MTSSAIVEYDQAAAFNGSKRNIVVSRSTSQKVKVTALVKPVDLNHKASTDLVRRRGYRGPRR